MGRAVYQGVYDPDCAHADANGFRTDVLDAMRPMGYTVMRYPGGNFASGYHWMDGIGPKDHNTYIHPKTIISQSFSSIEVLGGKGQLELPPLSMAAVTFEVR